MQGLFSPYSSNPLGLNPLRTLLEREIDFGAIRRTPDLKVFVSATHVRTGRAVIFSGARLSAQAVTASACLPTMFHAVNIDAEDYWDGGYSVNPPLTPLIGQCVSRDVMLVQINPLRHDSTPQKPDEILDRVNELTIAASGPRQAGAAAPHRRRRRHEVVSGFDQELDRRRADPQPVRHRPATHPPLAGSACRGDRQARHGGHPA